MRPSRGASWSQPGHIVVGEMGTRPECHIRRGIRIAPAASAPRQHCRVGNSQTIPGCCWFKSSTAGAGRGLLWSRGMAMLPGHGFCFVPLLPPTPPPLLSELMCPLPPQFLNLYPVPPLALRPRLHPLAQNSSAPPFPYLRSQLGLLLLEPAIVGKQVCRAICLLRGIN